MSGNETPTRGHIQINNVSKIKSDRSHVVL